MIKYSRCLLFLLFMIFLLTGCSKKQKYDNKPLMGLSWFMDMDQVKERLSSLELEGQRKNNKMTMLDYKGAKLYKKQMIVTLSFTSKGLVGISYHDTKHRESYMNWLTQIEDRYGAPDENAIDSVSWFDNPIGKNTAVYVYDLAEGVQISFFGTADTPDKTFDKRV